MKMITVHCEGESPLLMHPMTDRQLEDLRTQTRRPPKTDISREEEAAGKIYRENGTNSAIGIPGVNLFACLVGAGRHVPFKSRTKVSTKESTLLPSFLTIEDEFMPLVVRNGGSEFEPVTDWEVDTRRGVNKSNGAAVAIVRPKFRRWGFVAHCVLDENEANEDIVRKLFDKAGKVQGLCDFRPEKRGQFGKFRVVEWAVEDIMTEEMEETTA